MGIGEEVLFSALFLRGLAVLAGIVMVIAGARMYLGVRTATAVVGDVDAKFGPGSVRVRGGTPGTMLVLAGVVVIVVALTRTTTIGPNGGTSTMMRRFPRPQESYRPANTDTARVPIRLNGGRPMRIDPRLVRPPAAATPP